MRCPKWDNVYETNKFIHWKVLRWWQKQNLLNKYRYLLTIRLSFTGEGTELYLEPPAPQTLTYKQCMHAFEFALFSITMNFYIITGEKNRENKVQIYLHL